MLRAENQNNILYISTFPPRECGIATFTKDLAQALDQKYNPMLKSRIIALNDHPSSIYSYDKIVLDQIPTSDLEGYVSLAKRINSLKNVKVVSIQHEFGLFGGDWGNYLIPFLQVIDKPVVTTFHSVLPLNDKRFGERNDYLKKIVSAIAENSNAVVVMNKFSQEVLEKDYDIPRNKLNLIPHGIPQTQFESSENFKKALGLEGHTVFSTFGLLSPNKGVEYAIRALPNIVKKFPNIIYLVLGVTHPNIRKWQGESYRTFLMNEVDRLELKDHVKFHDKYLTPEELLNYLKATDIYIAPSIDSKQSVSGTISYALGCGRPVIATSSIYARYVINSENGILVKPRRSNEIENALLELLSDPKRVKSMSAGAYELSRKMIWPNVASDYFRLFKKVSGIEHEERKLPKIKLDHLRRLTDDFGILQFAKYTKPQKRYGYVLDDNARALMACVTYYEATKDESVISLIKTYIQFAKFAQRSRGTFANFVSYQKRRDSSEHEDVQGRTMWALGYTASSESMPDEVRAEANLMIKSLLKHISKFQSPRAVAFSIIGLFYYFEKNQSEKTLDLIRKLADYQIRLYKEVASEDWQWFEKYLTYSNSKLSESLLYAYKATKKREYLSVAQKTLDFLDKITFKDGMYWPIGQNGWYFQHKSRAYFDQQPEDTASMVQTKAVSYEITKNKRDLDDAFTAFQWFLGKNHLNQMIYDELSGGCNDGIHQNRVNLNQGAESTISYLLARLAIEKIL